MLIASASLFAVNGAVIEGDPHVERRSTSLRLTRAPRDGRVPLRSRSSSLLVAPGTAARRARARSRCSSFYGVVGFALVQWLYFVAIERLPIGIGLLLEFTAPVLVALWARLVWHEPVRRRVWAALALALAGLVLVAEVWEDVRLDGLGVAAGLARGRARSRRTTSRASTRPRGATPSRSTCLALGVAAALLGGRAAVVELPVRRARPSRCRSTARSSRRARRSGRSASGWSCSGRSSRSCSPSARSATCRRRASRSSRCSRSSSRRSSRGSGSTRRSRRRSSLGGGVVLVGILLAQTSR